MGLDDFAKLAEVFGPFTAIAGLVVYFLVRGSRSGGDGGDAGGFSGNQKLDLREHVTDPVMEKQGQILEKLNQALEKIGQLGSDKG